MSSLPYPARIVFSSQIAFVVALSLLFALPSGVRAADGWAALWTKNSAAAKPLFQKAAAGGAAEARRGLGLIAQIEDAPGVEAENWKTMYSAAPDSWQAAAYWQEFAQAARVSGKDALLIDACRAVLAKKNATPFLQASARVGLAETLYKTGKRPEADAAWAEMGYIRKWQIIGPFENASRSGLDRAYGPEAGGDFSKTYTGADGQILRWHPLVRAPQDGTVPVGAALGGMDANLFYAVTAINAPAAGQAALRFDANGATKIYLNGALVSRDPIYRDTQSPVADVLSVPVTLKAGWNVILVKIADDAERQAIFRLRLTGVNDSIAKKFAADASKAAPLPAVTEATPAPAPTAAVIALLRQRIAAAPDDLEARRALGVQLRATGDYEASLAALKEAVALAPNSGLMRWELAQSLKADGRDDEARAERETARKADKRLAVAQFEAITEKGNGITPTEKIKSLKALLADINPNSPSLLWGLTGAYSAAELPADVRRTSRRAADAAPGEEGQFRYCIHYVLGGQSGEAQSALTAALRRYPNSAVLLGMEAERRADQGNTAGAIALYQRMLTLIEASADERVSLADLYTAQRQPARAIQQLTAARQERPQDADLCAKLADALRESGKAKEAIPLYREAIRLDPSRVALREKLQMVSGEKPVARLVPPTDTAPIFAKLPKSKDYPGVSEVRVLDEGIVVVYPDYAQAHYTHEIVTIFDEAAVKRYQQFPTSAPSQTADVTVETARLLKADGKIVDARADALGDSVAFPSLAIGDTIDVVYRTEDYPRRGLSGKFWTEWFFSQRSGPVKLSRLVLITPKEMALNIQSRNGAPEPTTKDLGAWRVREWRTPNLPSDKLELLAPPFRDTGMWVDISSVPSWSEIVSWYQTLSAPRCIPDAVVRAKTDELTANLKTDDEKIRAILAFVSEKIPYQTTPFRLSAFVPTEGKEVLRDNFGDCKDKAALVTAMLNHVGIKSKIALVSPRSLGVTPYLPGPRFAHAISVIDTASGPLWADATADGMEFGNLPFEDQGVPALVIADGVTELTTTPVLPVEKTALTENIVGTLDAQGNLTATDEIQFIGGMAWLLRTGLRRVPESAHEQVLRSLFSTVLPDAKYTSGTLKGLETADGPIVITFAYTSPNFAQPAGNLLLTKAPWTDNALGGSSEALSGGANRRLPLELSVNRSRQISRVTLTLPPGYQAKDLQPEVKAESPFATYRFAYAQNGNTLTMERDTALTAQRIPAADVPEYLRFSEAQQKQSKTPLVLEKK